MLKSEIAAAEYRRQAAKTLEAAGECVLAQVRGKLRSAAQTWIIRAEIEDRRVHHAAKSPNDTANAVQAAGGAAGCA